MQIVAFDEARFRVSLELFPEGVARDSWTAYHGTHGAAEPAIDAEGFSWRPVSYSRQEVESVVELFKRLGWAGIHGGGLPVLLPFSLGHDFGDHAVKPTYFAECSARAALYATADYAGGETARALRYALDDLQQYLHSPEIRAKHQASVQREGGLVYTFGGAIRPVHMRMEELATELQCFASLRERCHAPLRMHAHGVVYAVRFSQEDADRLEHHVSMGLKARGLIHPSKIVAKVRIPSTFSHSIKSPDYSTWPIRRGLLRAIASPLGLR
jgi:hypothetical protein